MDLSQFVESADAQSEEDGWEEVDDQNLHAMTSTIYCHKCGGAGHTSPQCPSQYPKGKGKGASKGKGKGPTTSQKGQPKGSGKGKSRGPMYGACWTCGGAHFQQDCPQSNKGQVKGAKSQGKGFSLEEWPTPQAAIRSLCALRTSNRFAAPSDDQEQHL